MKNTTLMKHNRHPFAGVLLPASIGLLLALAVQAEQTNTAKAPPKSSATLPRVGVKELLSNPTNYAGKQIVLEGFVTDICKKKGCWAMLHDPDPDAKGLVRVKQDDDASNFKAFLPEIQGKTVLVTGEVHATRIDAEYLDKWEARVKEAQKDKTKEQEEPYAAVFKQIAGLRERVAKSKQGYLTSLGVAVLTWEAKTAQP
jgi:hypothetical protein